MAQQNARSAAAAANAFRQPGIHARADPRMFRRYRREALAFRAGMVLFRLIGLRTASALGGFLGRVVGPRTSRARTAARNLRWAFPDRTEGELAEIADGMWDNLGRTLAEFAHVDRFWIDRPGGRISFLGTEHIDRARAAGRSIVFVSGHFANWELMPRCAAQYGLRVGVLYRAPNNPFVRDWLVEARARSIAPVQIPKGKAGTRELIAFLAGGGNLAMLMDQKLVEGIAAPLLGHEAMTSPIAAQLALKHGHAILPASMVRHPGPRFEVVIHPPVELEDSGDRRADIAAATRRLNDILGGFIRAHPEQWLWIHRRWPDRPGMTG